MALKSEHTVNEGRISALTHDAKGYFADLNNTRKAYDKMLVFDELEIEADMER